MTNTVNLDDGTIKSFFTALLLHNFADLIGFVFSDVV